MKNILSYKAGTKFFGKEILDWEQYQIDHNASKRRQGQKIMNRFPNLKPDCEYIVHSDGHFRFNSFNIVKV